MPWTGSSHTAFIRGSGWGDDDDDGRCPWPPAGTLWGEELGDGVGKLGWGGGGGRERWHRANLGPARGAGAELGRGGMAPQVRRGQREGGRFGRTWGEGRLGLKKGSSLGKGTGTRRSPGTRNWDRMGWEGKWIWWRGQDWGRGRSLICCRNRCVQGELGVEVQGIKSLSQGWSNWSLLWKIQFCPYNHQRDPMSHLTCHLNQIWHRWSLILCFFFYFLVPDLRCWSSPNWGGWQWTMLVSVFRALNCQIRPNHHTLCASNKVLKSMLPFDLILSTLQQRMPRCLSHGMKEQGCYRARQEGCTEKSSWTNIWDGFKDCNAQLEDSQVRKHPAFWEGFA